MSVGRWLELPSNGLKVGYIKYHSPQSVMWWVGLYGYCRSCSGCFSCSC